MTRTWQIHARAASALTFYRRMMTSTGSAGLASDRAQQRVWVVTGTSSGLGRSLVNVALAQGDKVVATARKLESIEDLVKDSSTMGRIHLVKLDVTDPYEAHRDAAAQAVSKWGRVDVLVNNAGAGMPNITEEGGLHGYHTQFLTNCFGPMSVTNAFLPYMRARKSGTIVFVGSRSAWKSMLPMYGPYAASKAALNAAADAMSVEIAHLGIKVLNAVPGGLRTKNWVNVVQHPADEAALLPPLYSQTDDNGNPIESNKLAGDPGDPRLEDYVPVRRNMSDFMKKIPPTHVPGDPDKCAKAIIDVVCGNAVNAKREKLDWPDLNFLPLGPDAERDIRNKCERILKVLDDYGDVARGIVVDELQGQAY